MWKIVQIFDGEYGCEELVPEVSVTLENETKLWSFGCDCIGTGRRRCEIIQMGSFLYITHYKAAVVDTAQSEDGVYEVVLQSVGEPAWPFGPASGRLVLSSDERIISKTDFKIANDGASFSAQDWSVRWHDDHVEIILTGKEQAYGRGRADGADRT